MSLNAKFNSPQSVVKSSLRQFWASLILGLLMLMSTPAGYTFAQESNAPIPRASIDIKPASPLPAPGPLSHLNNPSWQDLTPEQQRNLQPLAHQWKQLKEPQKRKWMALGANYASLSPADQVKLHSRMSEWVKLSQQQRAQARLAYANTKKLSSDEKQANWQAYQALSADEKKRLLKASTRKTNGAATVSKPASQPKLVTIPVTRDVSRPMPDMTQVLLSIHPKTLLPIKPRP